MSLRGRWLSAVAGLASLVLLLAAVPALAALSAQAEVPLHPGEAKSGGRCVCERAALVNGWCPKCGVGYVAGIRVPSAILFEALDPHGHDIMPEAIECQECQVALATDGYCEECRYGFVDERLYFSHLTWLVARGRVASRVACRAHRSSEWCGPCGRGAMGNVVFDDPALCAAAVCERERLLDSIDVLERCELCATAMFMGSMCPICNLDYRQTAPSVE